MTHVLDTSAALTVLLRENGEDRVKAILADPAYVVGISTLTLFEIETSVFYRTGSREAALRAVEGIRNAVAEIVPVDVTIVDLARALRHEASARIATVDILIAATAVARGSILVHRDPHFTSLPEGRPEQDVLPDKD